ncbi:MAG TPA: hypothetical protein VEA40_12410 [Ramlibacter sp.]|nr:hypothetical protein [Ramlibacter sp.]
MELTSRTHSADDYAAAQELCEAQGWTDGLPVIPATRERITAMLEAAKLAPGTQLAFIEDRQVRVTAEKVAINAVMAGCKPEYMPVVAAAIRAMGDKRFGYHGPATSTNGGAIFLLVNGPVARRLEINAGDNLFGPGFRANATIGRAIRLVMRNVMGNKPGELDKACLGHGGKYSYCIAEDEAGSPWPPFHTTRGFSPEQDAVTVFAALAPDQYYNQLSSTPEGLLATLCAQMRISSTTGWRAEYALVFAGEHQAVLRNAGWSREDVQRYVWENCRASAAELKRASMRGGELKPEDEGKFFPIVEQPQDLLVIAAGGKAGAQSCFIPGWAAKSLSLSVTVPV